MNDFEKYSKEIGQATNEISLKEALQTERTGAPKLRDKLMVIKFSWVEALSFLTIIQSLVIFIALVPDSIVTVNSFLAYVNIPYQFPVEISSALTFGFIIFIIIFGFLIVRYVGTYRSLSEYSTKMTPGYFLLWKKIEELEKKVVSNENKNKENSD